jgi:acetylornithine/N-succinyldiaminopimelate aminotransferase
MGLAKGLGGGFPIGAVVANKLTSEVLSAGTHGSTFGGNFLAAAVAKEVLTKLLKPRFLDSVLENGDKLMEGIKNIADKNNDIIIGVRGKGLMIGIESKAKNTELVEALRDENLLAVPAAGNIVRFLPPLNIDISHVDIGLKILDKSIKRLKMK